MKHFLFAASLVAFALPNAASFAQSEDEARVQQQRAQRNAAIERMISPSTRAEAQRHQQTPRVERPQRSAPGGGQQFNTTPRVQPQRPSFGGNRGGQPRGITPAPEAPVVNAQRGPGTSRRVWRGGDGRPTRDWSNRTRNRGDDAPAVNPETENRGDAFRGRNWRNRDRTGNNTAGDWRNRGDNTTDWRNRSGERNWNRDGQRRWNRGGEGSRRHRHWDRTRRDRSWWRNNYTRFVLFGGGYYYLHNNYWYPAYGYNPYFTSYTYDAPLYAYNGLAPEQVIAEVQAELQRQGYYRGGVDGSFGPMTRRALLAFQEDMGLPVTGEIDEETLAALGFE